MNIFDYVVCDNSEDAENIIDRMREICANYGFATISDLYELASVPYEHTYAYDRQGWTTTKDFKIVRTDAESFMIRTPDPKDISSDKNVDNVNHPEHYMSYTGLETIDVIEAFTSDLTGMDAVCTANVIKYICRWKHKNGIEDLEKAQWYLNRLIEDNKPIERKSN